MHISLKYEYLFYKYFVRRSVGQATKGKNVKLCYILFSYIFLIISLLMDVVILVLFINISRYPNKPKPTDKHGTFWASFTIN